MLNRLNRPRNIPNDPVYREAFAPTEMLLCQRCGLCKSRLNVVPGRGHPHAPLWFLGEAPGADEDDEGFAFVGRAGRTLDMCIERADIPETQFCIVNLLKCRPPENRPPIEDEVKACLPWLFQQFDAQGTDWRPRVAVAMGRFAIGVLRGYRWSDILAMKVSHEVNTPFRTTKGMIVMPVFHPAYLLRNGEAAPGFIRALRQARELCWPTS